MQPAVNKAKPDTPSLKWQAVPQPESSSAISVHSLADEQATLLDLAQDTILRRNVFSVITFWNRAAEKLYGWKRGEALGKVSYELLRTQFPETLGKMQDKLFEENRWEGKLVQTRRDGSEIIVESHQGVQRDYQGRPVAIMEINRDITEHVRTEKRLRQMTVRLLHLQDEERRRIARELHDSTTQTLSAVSINVVIIQQALDGHLDPSLSKVLSDTVELAQQAGDEIRNLSHLLHPPDLETLGLLPAIRWYADAFAKRYGIRIALQLPDELTELSDELNIALFRVVQESLTNVQRHSCSETARIRVTAGADHITLEILDQGKGMPVEDPGVNRVLQSIGISGMHERLRQLGGRLKIDSGPCGTAIRARVPVSLQVAAKR